MAQPAQLTLLSGIDAVFERAARRDTFEDVTVIDHDGTRHDEISHALTGSVGARKVARPTRLALYKWTAPNAGVSQAALRDPSRGLPTVALK